MPAPRLPAMASALRVRVLGRACRAALPTNLSTLRPCPELGQIFFRGRDDQISRSLMSRAMASCCSPNTLSPTSWSQIV